MRMRWIPAVLALLIFVLNSLGVCYRELRIRSTEDYIDIAIEAAGLPNTLASSVDDFKRRFPDCCRVYYNSFPNEWNWLAATCFSFSVVVEVKYVDQFGDTDGFDWVRVTKCGEIRHW